MQLQQPITSQKNSNLVLIFGATGQSGYHITNRFLQLKNKYSVRVVVRSKDKLQRLFQAKAQHFESIIQGSFYDDQILKKAFQPSSICGRVSIVISALGVSVTKSLKQVDLIEQIGPCQIVDKCVENKVDKFVIITAALIQRPYHPITFLLNTMSSNVFCYKANTENYIRKSGLKSYVIVRPPQLIGGCNQKDQEDITGYNLDQGDKIIGKISRRTLSNVVLHALQQLNGQGPKKVTFQCQQQLSKKPDQKQDFTQLKEDNQDSILKVNHRKATYVIWIGILLVVVVISLSFGLGFGLS